MSPSYTRGGDEGETGILGKGRVPKDDLRVETLGTIDEASSALGLARATCQSAEIAGWIATIQRDLYLLMAEAAALSNTAGHFRGLDSSRVSWLEGQIRLLEGQVTVPTEFILPGDSLGSAAVDFARTVVRRAERALVALDRRERLENRVLLGYLNRLSSYLYLLELKIIQDSGRPAPSLAKGRESG